MDFDVGRTVETNWRVDYFDLVISFHLPYPQHR